MSSADFFQNKLFTKILIGNREDLIRLHLKNKSDLGMCYLSTPICRQLG